MYNISKYFNQKLILLKNVKNTLNNSIRKRDNRFEDI